jgi:Cu+-exporting ATPase
MSVNPAKAAAVRSYEGRDYFFCAVGCAKAFDSDPARYAEEAERASDR